MGRNAPHFFSMTRGLWHTPKQRADDEQGFPTNTLEGGLKSPKALQQVLVLSESESV